MRTQAGWALVPALAGLLAGAVPGVAQAEAGAAGVAPPTAVTTAATTSTTTATRTVTLITGDKVTLVGALGALGALGAKPAISVQHGAGRAHIAFRVVRTWTGARQDISVVPADARALLGSGRLDPRLFDVTGLIAAGRDDASARDLSMIYSSAGGQSAAARASLQRHGVKVTRTLDVLHGGVITRGKAGTTSFWAFVSGKQGLGGPIRKLWLNGRSKVADDQSAEVVGAPEVWASGYTGKGVTVADLDTGYDATHPDLRGKAVQTRDFTDGGTGVVDKVGHGTHTASIIAGTGAASGGTYKGIAPDARLLIGKVCDDDGYCDDDAVIEGMTWAAEAGVTAANLSLGEPVSGDSDLLSSQIKTLTRAYGTLFVVAAGNDGAPVADYLGGTVETPGVADDALTVGSTTKQDVLSVFSSRGPRAGDFAVKPDIVAPGEDIIAAHAAGTDFGTPAGSGYVSASGTSMATPHVTGAVALLAQEHPTWKAADFKAALTSAAKGLPGLSSYDQGTGRLDVARAAAQTVRATSGTVDFGKVAWPHAAAVRTGTVTYTNDGAADVVLNLSIDAYGPKGAPVPAGAFQLGTDTLTVPAGGTASTTVTADVSADFAGAYGGSVVATAAAPATALTPGDIGIRAAFGLYAEAPSHTVTVLGRDGRAVADSDVSVFDPRTGLSYAAGTDSRGKVAVRLPDGEYDLSSDVETDTSSVLLTKPGFKLSADVSVTLDGRAAKRVNLTVDRAGATSDIVVASATSTTANGAAGVETDVSGDPWTPVYATPSATVTSHPFWYTAAQAWTGTVAKTSTRPAWTYAYNLLVSHKGSVPGTLTQRVHDSSLAAVKETYATEGGRPIGLRGDLGVTTFGAGLVGEINAVRVPGAQTRFYSTDPQVRWSHLLVVGTGSGGGADDGETQVVTKTQRYSANKTYTRTWNRGPLRARSGQALRLDNSMLLSLGLFSPDGADMATDSGEASGVKGTATLYRNGVQVASVKSLDDLEAEVPAARATYSVKTFATRKVAWSALGTKASSTWTFASGSTPSGSVVSLPLLNVRLNGPVSTSSVLVGGKTYTFSVNAERGSSAAVTALGVQISFDDGKTWRSPRTTRSGDRATFSTAVPKTAGYASIRLTAKDKAGDTVSQTVIRSFRITK